MAAFTVKTRSGPQVRRERFGELTDALDHLRATVQNLADGAHGRTLSPPLMRDFEPVQQVHGRIELSGPGLRAGVDVRGDGSSEAFTGRLRKRLVEQLPGEDAVDALRRTLRER